MYDYQLSDAAEGQLVQLPFEAVIAVSDVIAAACADPWNYQRRPEESLDRHFAHRWALTDDGRAKVWFLIRDGEGLLWVTEIEWRG